jgi:hypothetical protein
MNRTFSGILHDFLTVLGVGILPSLAISAPIAAALCFGLKHFIQNRRYKREYKLWWQEWCEAKAAERKMQDATIGNSIGGIADFNEDDENNSKPTQQFRDSNQSASMAKKIFAYSLVFLIFLLFVIAAPIPMLISIVYIVAMLLQAIIR